MDYWQRFQKRYGFKAVVFIWTIVLAAQGHLVLSLSDSCGNLRVPELAGLCRSLRVVVGLFFVMTALAFLKIIHIEYLQRKRGGHIRRA